MLRIVCGRGTVRPRPLLQGEVRAWCLASRVADAADCTNVLVLSRCWTARYSGPASSFCPTFLSARASSSCSRTSPLRLTQTATSPSTKTRSPTNSLQTLTARPGNSGRARLPLKWAARETALRAPRRTPARDPQCAGTGAAPKSHCLAGLWDCLRACFGNASGLSFGPQRAHTRPFTCGTRLQTCSICPLKRWDTLPRSGKQSLWRASPLKLQSSTKAFSEGTSTNTRWRCDQDRVPLRSESPRAAARPTGE